MASLEAAIRLHQAGRSEEAEQAYRQVLAAEPNHAGALHLLGVIRQQQGRHEESLELIGRAVGLNPTVGVYRNNYGAALLSLQRFVEAKNSFLTAIRIRPDYADALANLGMAQAAMGEETAAEESFLRALKCQAWHRDAVTRLAGLLGRLGRAEEADQLLGSALAASPCPQFYLALGNLRLAAGRSQEAAQHYRKAMQGGVTPRAQTASDAPDWLVYRGAWDDGDCQAGPSPLPKGEATWRKVAFISPHCLLDFTNGAATATLDALKLLAKMGFQCEAFCGSRFDAWEGGEAEAALTRRAEGCVVRHARIGAFQGRMFFTSHGDIRATLVDTGKPGGGWIGREEIAAFLAGCEIFLDRTRPELVWTYGGDPLALVVQGMAKERGIPILFALHNFSYPDLSPFRMPDRVVVPTEFARRFYGDKLGLTCDVLPLVVDPERVEIRRTEFIPSSEGHGNGMNSVLRNLPSPRSKPLRVARVAGRGAETACVTFVNPEPRKGVHVFARIAEVLSRRRPDIPLLLVEGASKASFLPKLGIDLSEVKNLVVMPNTPDARQFLATTKLLLMPSLTENAAVVAMEAMLNGIPVLGSNRGGLPETIGDAGFLFDIPARYTPDTRDLPTAEEVEPWLETIIRLWDDAAEYDRWSRAARERAERWRPENLIAVYAGFFGNLLRTPELRASVPRCPVPATASVATEIVRGRQGARQAAATTRADTSKTSSTEVCSSTAKPFVTCKWLGRSGRLGNHLFQIAATIGTARKNGLDFVFPPWDYARYFQRTIPQSAEIPPANLYAEPSFAYREIRVCRPTDLAGSFQSERYFEHCPAEIRGYFAPRAELLAALREEFGALLSKPTCSVHVRRGDYVRHPEYVDLAATDYYERAIERFPADTTFLFFSDDSAWCRNRFRDRRFVFVQGQSSIEDLFLMSLCGGHIIANSSFSWWGAWLDDRPRKTVVAPLRWFAGSYANQSLPFSSRPYQGYHDPRDIIPQDWVKV